MEDAGGSAVAPAKEKKNTNELFPLRVSRKPSFPLTLSLPPPCDCRSNPGTYVKPAVLLLSTGCATVLSAHENSYQRCK